MVFQPAENDNDYSQKYGYAKTRLWYAVYQNGVKYLVIMY